MIVDDCGGMQSFSPEIMVEAGVMEEAVHQVCDHLIEMFCHPVELRGMSRCGGMLDVLALQVLVRFSQHVLDALVGDEVLDSGVWRC